MPWCPNCRTEFQEGITVCSDCKAELVDNLEAAEVLEPFFQIEDKKIADKLNRFLDYSGVKSELHYDEENELYIIDVLPRQQKDAKKLYQAFCYVERERIAKEVYSEVNTDEAEDSQNENFDIDLTEVTDQESEQDEDAFDDELGEIPIDVPSDDISSYDDEREDTGVYVMKADQYKDLSGTVIIFLLFGIVGGIIVILNIIGIINLFHGWLPNTVLGAMFLAFIYIALSTNRKAKKVKAEIEAENKLTEEINQWLKLNVTESFLASLRDDQISDEMNYIKMTDTIKEMLIKEFGPQNLAYLDRLIDEYYSSNFDEE